MAEEQPKLTVLSGPMEGTVFVVDDSLDTALIGSDPSCRFVIDAPGVSPVHARLWIDLEGITVSDTNSVAGLYVNDDRVVGQAQLRNGDILWLGTPGDNDAVMIQCRVPAGATAAAVPAPPLAATAAPPAASIEEEDVGGATIAMRASDLQLEPPPADEDVAAVEPELEPEEAAAFVEPELEPEPEPTIAMMREPDAAPMLEVDETPVVEPTVAMLPDVDATVMLPDVDPPADLMPDADAPPLLDVDETPPPAAADATPPMPLSAWDVAAAEETLLEEPPPLPKGVRAADAVVATAGADAGALVASATSESRPIPPPRPEPPAPVAPPPLPKAPRAQPAQAPPPRPAPPAAKPREESGRRREPVARPAAAVAPAAEPVARKGAPMGLLIGGGLAAAVLVAAGGWWLLSREPAPPATATTTAEPVAPPPSTAAAAPAATLAPAVTALPEPAPVEEVVTIVPPSTAAAAPSVVPSRAPAAPPTTQVAAVAPPPVTAAPAPAAPAPGVLAAELASRGEAARRTGDLDAAAALYDQALRADPANAAAQAGRTAVNTARAAARKAFIPSRTIVQTPSAKSDLGGGFDTADVSVKKAPDFSGRIDFAVSPARVKPGDNYTVQIFLVNEGKKAIKISGVTMTTNLNGSKAARPVPSRVKEVAPAQRALIEEMPGVWPEDVNWWSAEIVVSANKGESLKNTLSWK